MAREVTTINTWGIAIARALDVRGLDSAGLFAQVGLDPAILHEPNGRYPVSRMAQLWKLAIKVSGDPCLALKAAAYVQPATFHSLGLALMASQNLDDALQRASRYSRIVSNAVDLRTVHTERGVKQVARFLDHAPVVDEGIDLLMASNYKIGRMLTGLDQLPVEIRLRRDGTAAMHAEFEAYFHCPVYFRDEENSLLIPHEWMQQPLPMANPELARQNDRVVVEYLRRFDGARISEKVRAELISRLPAGEPARVDVSSMLNMSEKTLQRRLKDEGSSYQQILDETRCDLAQQYLREPGVSVCEVTFRLGFSDQSSFTRAFKRWTGIAPGEFRNS
ncbi:MAG TPA: AraC family transcriptional regulator [Stenotrophobium sp.]|jgi:AraC-like DNA-binding protein|nr:AraC family transcriptional regulator [Stenotrophobium sp.]